MQHGHAVVDAQVIEERAGRLDDRARVTLAEGGPIDDDQDVAPGLGRKRDRPVAGRLSGGGLDERARAPADSPHLHHTSRLAVHGGREVGRPEIVDESAVAIEHEHVHGDRGGGLGRGGTLGGCHHERRPRRRCQGHAGDEQEGANARGARDCPAAGATVGVA